MAGIMQEVKNWIPFFFYAHGQDKDGLQLRSTLQMFVRGFLHILMYFPPHVILIVALILSSKMLSDMFWETSVGIVLMYILVIMVVLLPFRIARRPSYILYRKIFGSKAFYTS